jgi:cysteine-rich repeat protein
MAKLFNRLVFAGAIFLAAFALTACGGGGGSSNGVSDSGGGTTFWLTDAPAEYQAVYVTINEVQVNPTEDEEDGWEPITDLDLPDQFELLMLSNGARTELGIADLAPGHYNQMRLILSEEQGANYVIDADDDIVDLKVPSGGKTGIKLGNGFEITGDSTDIVLDFSVNKSVHVHPTGKNNGKDKWILRPTVRVVEIENSVEGAIDAGARVSAQVNDPNAENVKDEVVEVASANEENGAYFMYLPVNTTGIPYNLVATKEDFEPECQSLDSTASAEYTGIDFTLTAAAATGALSGSINPPIPEETATTDSVSLSIRREVDCSGDATMVEVGSLNFANPTGGPIPYGPVTLPEGEYEIVAWADDPELAGEVIILDPIAVSVPPPAEQDPLIIDFVPPVCGDGILNAGEQCDDGNNIDGDGCQAGCQLPVCGDGILDAGEGEECDDGNNIDDDGCQADCTLP